MLEKPTTADASTPTSGLRDILALVAGRSKPIQVGDIALDEDGQLRVRKDGEPTRFCFAYRGVDFDAHMDWAPEVSISLSAELGKVPYSMQTGGGRRLTRRIVEATADLPGGRIEMSETQDMSITATAQPPLPLTPASVMATITALLLDLGPYIDLLRGVIEAAACPGTPAPAADSSAAG